MMNRKRALYSYTSLVRVFLGKVQDSEVLKLWGKIAEIFHVCSYFKLPFVWKLMFSAAIMGKLLENCIIFGSKLTSVQEPLLVFDWLTCSRNFKHFGASCEEAD